MKELARILPLLSIVIAGCASTGQQPAAVMEPGYSLDSPADSLETADFERLFLEAHSRIIRRIEALRPRMAMDPVFIEAEAVLKIAEEFYLEGNAVMAVRLLTEAELILGRIPDAPEKTP